MFVHEIAMTGASEFANLSWVIQTQYDSKAVWQQHRGYQMCGCTLDAHTEY